MDSSLLFQSAVNHRYSSTVCPLFLAGGRAGNQCLCKATGLWVFLRMASWIIIITGLLKFLELSW